MKKFFSSILIVIFVISLIFPQKAIAEQNIQLNALSACLIDGDTGRVLYEKNGYDKRAMASTTKIMTLTIALEQANMEDVVTISQNAARQPDVQLNVNTGEQYYLGDLVYSLMLESHNDVAVAIAEHIGGSEEGFAALMNEKAKVLGCLDTHFVTPNGLDATDEGGMHSTTAVDLARIAAYAIQNEEFVKIIGTRSHTFQEINGKRQFTVNNKDAFLDMMEGAIGVKTGFTGNAGYCFVGAVKQDGRTFISVVLGSGWPPNKSYKWKDTRKLMQIGIDNYFPELIYEGRKELAHIDVMNGIREEVFAECEGNLTMLLADTDEVKVFYEYPCCVEAPVEKGEQIGTVSVYVNRELYGEFPIILSESVREIEYSDYLNEVLKKFLF